MGTARLLSQGGNVDLTAGAEVDIQAQSGVEVVVSSGGISQTSTGSNTITVDNGSLSSIVTTAPSFFTVETAAMTMLTDRFEITGTVSHMRTLGTSNQCGATIPAPSLPGTESTNFFQDVVFHSGTELVTTEPDGFLRVGPAVEICSGRLRAPSPAHLSLESKIRNDNSGQGVIIDDADGLDLEDTPITSSTSSNIVIESGKTLTVDAIIDSGLGSVNILGTVFTAGGNINTGSGSITTNIVNANSVVAMGGSCCASDLRVKRNITRMQPRKSLKRILDLKPIEYEWKPEILKEDSFMIDEVVRGFGAQDVKEVVPGAVRTQKRTIGSTVYSDFHTLHKDAIIPDMVAAMQAMYAEIQSLRAELQRIKTVN
jgi:hypothetical protein